MHAHALRFAFAIGILKVMGWQDSLFSTHFRATFAAGHVGWVVQCLFTAASPPLLQRAQAAFRYAVGASGILFEFL